MPYLAPIVLLFASNIFMTFAWYGQLKYPAAPLLLVIPVSWGIAFFEYCLAVPANRIGHQVYSAPQLKTMQEIITLLVFGVFSVLWLGESLKWNTWSPSCSYAGRRFSPSTNGVSGLAARFGSRRSPRETVHRTVSLVAAHGITWSLPVPVRGGIFLIP
jgi:hypothetical protein